MLFTALLCTYSQQRGKASYYSKRATGARTSSGILLHNDSLVCAHRTHPFGTKLLVRNLTNDKEVIVTVVDRGPYKKGRIIDLTYAAAEQLGMISKGVVAVEVSVYPDKGVPYALDPESLPEIDLEEHEVATTDEGYNAVWIKSQQKNETKELAQNLIKEDKSTKSSEVKKTQPTTTKKKSTTITKKKRR